ncbi:phage replication protein, partial [Pseudomonas sp. BAgro211]|nr:phage replication protein [Pseudomonas sp. BAgro211]
PDTVYRLLKQLAGAGVIDLSSTASITLVRLTPKGQEWNRKLDGSEKYPTHLGKKSEVGKSSDVGEKSDPTDGARSEKNPRKVGEKSE